MLIRWPAVIYIMFTRAARAGRLRERWTSETTASGDAKKSKKTNRTNVPRGSVFDRVRAMTAGTVPNGETKWRKSNFPGHRWRQTLLFPKVRCDYFYFGCLLYIYIMSTRAVLSVCTCVSSTTARRRRFVCRAQRGRNHPVLHATRASRHRYFRPHLLLYFCELVRIRFI